MYPNTKQIYYLPKAKTVKEEDGSSRKMHMYDEKYDCIFDKIDIDGLSPICYKHLFEESISRIKDENIRKEIEKYV